MAGSGHNQAWLPLCGVYLIASQLALLNATVLRLPCKVIAAFDVVLSGMADGGSVGNSTAAVTPGKCALNCVSWPKCKSLNFKEAEQKCELFDRSLVQSKDFLIQQEGSVYMTSNDLHRNIGENCQRFSPCKNGGQCVDTCETNGFKCVCNQFAYGDRCQSSIQDCNDVKLSGETKSGIYEIEHLPSFKLSVYCSMEATESGGWILIQRRIDGSTDFNLDWNDYKSTFGDLHGNYWIGLENLHKLAGPGRQSVLKVEFMRSGYRTLFYGLYSIFEIGDESTGYRMLVGGFEGNVEDSLKYHNGMKFSTRDRDNDGYSQNCAIEFGGPWWYKGCFHSNLNSVYSTGQIGWRDGSRTGKLTNVAMKIQFKRKQSG